ncbi:hypothetical protein [Ralstonia pickettii]|uniref:Uncharacterized protein n=1 Tax=Ralstonia pickettii TaxID=329 RepID=A0AAW4QAB8_RALPI|nr:hypothetical protein [Ralstonia pickettii]MBA9846800.1 hypothetical protein [Ralstonia pickettii]MBA9852048.1 hypothetical protein [Ralstonia pickettii]MBA9919937.1 hypothetical protein [Ralstonia pickettii]MBA9959039.1 hypothetical protein [Ralstonia pickettii]MBA9964582.1 hypothetical protein [Ralstonia pickettii]
MQSIIINPTHEQELSHPNGIFVYVDEDVDGVLMGLHERFARRSFAAWAGRTRNVFQMRGGYVVKLPKNFLGIRDNDWEGAVSNAPDSLGCEWHVQYPRTRLAVFDEVPVVFMEFVKPLSSQEIVSQFGHEPEWVMSVDGGQVGVNRAGRLVAYDYGVC